MAKRKQVIKTARIELDGDYEGWWFEARTNLPLSAWADIVSGNFERIITGLSEAMLAWNFVDEEGDDLPDLTQARADRRTQRLTGTYVAEQDPLRLAVGRLPFDLVVRCAKEIDAKIGEINPS